MSSDTRSNATVKLYLPVIVATTVIIPAILAVQLVLNFRHEYFLTHVEGVWLLVPMTSFTAYFTGR